MKIGNKIQKLMKNKMRENKLKEKIKQRQNIKKKAIHHQIIIKHKKYRKN